MFETETIKFAASKPPGERQVKEFNSFDSSFHVGGTVQDIPCTSHIAFVPPANAAVWAAFGSAFSAVISLPPEFEPVPVSDDFLNRFVRLQSDSDKQMKSTSGTYFIGSLDYWDFVKAWCFYSKFMRLSIFEYIEG
jgi:hypothetical protein